MMLLPEAIGRDQHIRTLPATRSMLSGFRSHPLLASLALFGIAYVSYVLVGALIVFGTGSIPLDTWARVGNAYYALFSRDPHLGAIGFVLSPLPTLAILPILPFKALWPALVTSAFAGPLTSALFMAGAVVLVRRILRDLAVPRWLTWLLVALFALHPMIVYHGANGLTEAPFLFFLLWATSSLLRWLDRGGLADLVRLGMALAIGYLTRYEFMAVMVATVAVVALVAYLRAPGTRAERRAGALADVIVVGMPFGLAFTGWALVSWLLVGSPFAQFTSVYGNSSQIQILRDLVIQQTGQGLGSAPRYVAAQVLGLAPLLPLIGVLAVIRAGWRVDLRVLAPVAVIGGPLAFSVLAFLMGSTVGFLRYEIAAIPLLVVLAGVLLTRNQPMQQFHMRGSRASALDGIYGRLRRRLRIPARLDPRPGLRGRQRSLGAGGATLGLLVTMGVALSIPTSFVTMRHPYLAREEADALRIIIGNDPPATDPSYVLATHAQSARVAAAIDALDLSRGTILLDVALGNPIVLQSAHPDWFVITPDRDFTRVLADPAAYGVRYLVVPANESLGSLDALNRAYPTLYATGAGFATLAGEFDEPEAPGWRLYRMVASE